MQATLKTKMQQKIVLIYMASGGPSLIFFTYVPRKNKDVLYLLNLNKVTS